MVASVVEGESNHPSSLDADESDDDLGFEEEEDFGLADALDTVDLADNSRGADDDDLISDEEY